ncbi:MAG: hypothetical protein EOO73_03390 [Myxococcales bacterium]|nr:MAG: hypothetical protein EOO73_03390 [Myxococcales bacterium]
MTFEASPDTRARRLALAIAIYTGITLLLLACASRETRSEHTPYNHFALLAEGWLHGRLDLGGAPPSYAGGNDFASYGGKWFVVFPPLPGLLLLPIVALRGGAERVADGLFFLLLAGLAPATLFLALEKLRQRLESRRTELENVVLACLFCLGSVYFFCSLQGTVWYAAHVVGAVLMAAYFLFAVGAERPLLAGVCLALGFATRAPLVLAAPLFVLEAVRETGIAAPAGAPLFARYDTRRLGKLLAWFALPLAAAVAVSLWHNAARFGSALEPGYRYLNIVWAKRIATWGLFDYHYLAKNLGVMLTSLPWLPADEGPVQVNAHGLALWVTTPMYLWLLVARRWSPLSREVLLCVALVALPTLFYQNTGWVQFGYRFSNDYAPLLFVLLAIVGPPLRGGFMVAAALAVVVNFFGALTFGRPEHARFYVIEPTQKVLYQPD